MPYPNHHVPPRPSTPETTTQKVFFISDREITTKTTLPKPLNPVEKTALEILLLSRGYKKIPLSEALRPPCTSPHFEEIDSF